MPVIIHAMKNQKQNELIIKAIAILLKTKYAFFLV